jgi:hypothetical protein
MSTFAHLGELTEGAEDAHPKTLGRDEPFPSAVKAGLAGFGSPIAAGMLRPPSLDLIEVAAAIQLPKPRQRSFVTIAREHGIAKIDVASQRYVVLCSNFSCRPGWDWS